MTDEPPEDPPGWTLIGGSLMLVLWTACEAAGLTEEMGRIEGTWEGGAGRAHLTLELEEVAGHLSGRYVSRVHRRPSSEPHTWEGQLEGRLDARARLVLHLRHEDRPDERFVGVLLGRAPALAGTWQGTQGTFDLTLRPAS